MASEQQQQMPTDSAPGAMTGSLLHHGGVSSGSNSGSSHGQGFAPLAFDESLVTAMTTGSTDAVTATNTKSAADFFLDQISAVVSDEKKLSDNIMDLIPPVEAPVSQASGTRLEGSNTGVTSSINVPLQPPPGLMMRALSPPTSLLPDFGDVTSLSLLGDGMVTGTATGLGAFAPPTTTTVTAALKRELPVVRPVVSGTTTAMTRQIDLMNAVHKKQKTENLQSDAVAKGAVSAPPAVGNQVQQLQQARHHHHNNGNELGVSVAAGVAREKVMKEPQSGDLYECVITKRNGGLGLTLACVDDHVQITGLAPDTPAASSGICVGDTLVAVSGLPVRGLQFSTVIGRLKSTSRNSVVLKLRRNPFRQNAGGSASYRGMKRPNRGVIRGPDSSNSANVLSSKTMALETRIGGGQGNGLNGSPGSSGGVFNSGTTSAGLDDLHRSHHQGLTGFANHTAGTRHAQHQQLKSEPMNSTYFPTDASVLTMGATASNGSSAMSPSAVAPSSVLSDSQAGRRVSVEEKDRYYAECRSLRHELGRVMVAQRCQKRDTGIYTSQLQAVVDKFKEQVRSLGLTSSAAVSTNSSPTEPSNTVEEVTALRLKLVEANQALAKRHAEILMLQDREARHALPESQRLRSQVVMNMRKSVLQIDCKAASKLSSTPSVKTVGVSAEPILSFEERFEGVRPSAFALLVGQSEVTPALPIVELELDVKTCTEFLGWNLREVVIQAAGTYTVSVADSVHVRYLRTEEALVVAWTLCVKDHCSSRK
uniref:PDZ domain-containing protein n=1 Tax=Peronospora matthiolae TaxID=2874970 RepID=A0AAV1TA31_9STRA